MYTKTRRWRMAVIAGVVVLLFASFASVGFLAGNEIHKTSPISSGKTNYALFPIGLLNDLLAVTH